METPLPTVATGTPPAPPAPASIPGAPAARRVFANDAERKAHDAERKRLWRAKLRAGGVSTAGAPPPAPSPAPGAPQPAPLPVPDAAGSPPVPWSGDLLRPIFEQVLPALETADINGQMAEAAPLGQKAVALVKQKAPWNPAAKQSLIVSGPNALAKMMNKTGISAEHADITIAVTSALSIYAGRQLVISEIRKMVEEAKADQAKERKPDAPAS